MKTYSNLLLVGAALALPCSTTLAAAATDTTTQVNQPASAPTCSVFSAFNHGEAYAESTFSFFNDAGPMQKFLEDSDVIFTQFSSKGILSFGNSLPGFRYSTFAPSRVSGTLYGFDLGYTVDFGRIGSFTCEVGYRSGTLDGDSGTQSFGGAGSIATDGSPIDWNVHGTEQRLYSIDNEELSFLALWRPKGIGDWLAVGIGYDHQELDANYAYIMNMTGLYNGLDMSMGPYKIALSPSIKTDDILAHVRLGGKPFAHLLSGKLAVSAVADIAAGYSFRDQKHMSTQLWIGDQLLEDDDSDFMDFSINTWVFKGGASLVFDYEVLGGTLSAKGGFACESDFGKDRMGETKGLTTSVGYRINW